MKFFIITIDTEGDNLWNWEKTKKITTNNSGFLPRFQDLCNSYSFKPVWLCNWEMIHDDPFVEFVVSEEKAANCEIGMHLHAWNNPPIYELDNHEKSGPPYLIEYPIDIMKKKISTITKEFKRIFGHQAISHRAGRWAINDDYLQILYENGYKVDCSITPGIDWSESMGQKLGFYGPDYSGEILETSVRRGIFEVPMTTYISDYYSVRTLRQLRGKKRAKYIMDGFSKRKRVLYLRPDGTNLSEMKWIVKKSYESDLDYLMFMIHSSELMPNGSPKFADNNAIEKLYGDLDNLFTDVSKYFKGCTLSEYYNMNQGLHPDIFRK